MRVLCMCIYIIENVSILKHFANKKVANNIIQIIRTNTISIYPKRIADMYLQNYKHK